MTRMTTITISMWTALPIFGMLGMYLGPRKPRSQSIARTTTIVHNMRVLLLSDWHGAVMAAFVPPTAPKTRIGQTDMPV